MIPGQHRPEVKPHGAHDIEGPTVQHLGHTHPPEELASPEPDQVPYRPLPVIAFQDEAIDTFTHTLGYLTGESTKLRTGDDTGYAARITHMVAGLWADTDAFLQDLTGDILTVQPIDGEGVPFGKPLAISLNEISRVTIL